MIKSGLILAVLFFGIVPLGHAKDVSAKQVGVEVARQSLEKAEAEHKDNLQRQADSEKRLADAQQRLTEDKKKVEDSKKALEEAKAKYVKAQELLDQAWKQP